MFVKSIRNFVLFAIIFLGLFPMTSTLIAQQFRIETEVYRGDDPEAISENLTLFQDNLIVDFLLPTDKTRFPEEIVIYLSNEKRFVLLDTSRQVKTEIIEGEVLKILNALQSTNLAEGPNEFLFHPQFTETYDMQSGWLTMEQRQLTYRTRGTRPEDDTMLHKYYEFIDQFARLNATDPRRMPPFARLKLNASLKKYGFLPDEVEVTLIPSLETPSDTIVVRSKHNVIWQLSETDNKRIESAKRYWMDFEEVSLAEFRNLQQTAENEKQTSDR